jgi:AmmeMemoRadiSam system protein A
MKPSAPLSPGDRSALLGLARAALRHRLGEGPAPTPPAAGPLAEPRGAFLTIATAGQPRASLGWLAPQGPVGEAVARLAALAADRDPRWPPLTPADLPSLTLSLAVLGPARRLQAPDALRPGLDGVAVTHGWHRSVLLPSAAGSKAWQAGVFLKHACLAAGLPADAYLEPEAAIEVFEAEEFGE